MVKPNEIISRLKEERYTDWGGGYAAIGCELADEAIAFIEEQAKVIEALRNALLVLDEFAEGVPYRINEIVDLALSKALPSES